MAITSKKTLVLAGLALIDRMYHAPIAYKFAPCTLIILRPAKASSDLSVRHWDLASHVGTVHENSHRRLFVRTECRLRTRGCVELAEVARGEIARADRLDSD